MAITQIRTILKDKMDHSIEAFRHNLAKIRTGRASPALLESVHVDYYGSSVPISQVANLSLLDTRTVSVQPWEKGMGAKIEKAIRDSDLGLNPASMGDLIRVPFPPMSYYMLWHERSHAAPPLRWLREQVRDAAQALPPEKR